MELNISVAFLIVLISIFLSGFFSGSEIAFVQSSKVRMEIEAARGGMIDRILSRFSHNEDMFISTLLVGNNIVLVIYGIAFSAIVNPMLESYFHSDALVLISNTIVSTLIILFTGEFIPKATFRINPNTTMRIIAFPLYLVYFLLYPISLLISGISRGLMRIFGIERPEKAANFLSIERLNEYIQNSIDEQHDDSVEIESEVKIFRNAIDFKDTQIGECMTPRNEIAAVNIDTTTREQLVAKFIDTGFSKIIVFGEDIDNVLGYIHVSELFKSDTDWKKMIKPVIFTPFSMLANTMMRRMLAEKKSVVVVIDEFGGTAGMVTLEDLVEEICGDFEDEHDKKRLVERQIDENKYEFSGRVEIESINERFHLDLPESDEYHTLAGFILENLEELPVQGQTFDIGNLNFKILKMSATRIELVGVTVN